jgi:hypothetical protein
LIAFVVDRLERGQTKGAAIQDAANDLGRPFEGTRFRLNTALKGRLAEALASKPVSDSAAVDPVAQPAPAQPSPAQPANAEWRPDAALSASTLSPIEQHLLAMPAKGGWTLEIDLHLLELSEMGWTLPEIATETGRDGRAVSERFDLLTGYDRDTKARKWKRADLLAAARDWCAKTYPTPAAE